MEGYYLGGDLNNSFIQAYEKGVTVSFPKSSVGVFTKDLILLLGLLHNTTKSSSQ